MKSQHLLRLRGVDKSYRRGPETIHALRHADLAIEPGEMVAVTGPSGSGKTTLLNVVAGWEHPDSGVVERTSDPAGGGRIAWRELAMVTQRLALIEELPVSENVELPLTIAGVLDHDALERSAAVMEDLQIFHLRDRHPLQTSLGEQQRTAVARALVLEPALVVADEPTGHQDADHATKVLAALRATTQRGGSVLLATHDARAGSFCDRTLEMSDGYLQEGAR